MILAQGLSWSCRQDVGWGLQSCEGLTVARGSDSKITHSRVCCLEASVPNYVALTIGLLMTCQLTSPRVSDSRENEWGGSHGSFHDLVPEIIHHHVCFILFIRSESLNLAHTRRGSKCHLLKEKVSNNLWMYFKTTPAFDSYLLCTSTLQCAGDPGIKKIMNTSKECLS